MSMLPPPTPKKLGLVIDLVTCVGFHACAVALSLLLVLCVFISLVMAVVVVVVVGPCASPSR